MKLGHRISAHLPVSVYPGMRIKRVDEEWGLLQEVYDRYTDTGTIALPGIVARELNRIRATDFHFEDKALEIKLRNVVESGFGLTKERTLEILDEHKLILRKEFFVDSTATGEMKDPWERGYKQERYLKARETILAACVNAESCTAAGDHDEARNQYRILKRDIDEYELEGNCPESRKLAIRIYAGRGDLYAQMGEADLAMSSYKDAAELAEMMLNSERSDEVYTALAVLDNKIGEMYGRCGDALNASAYRKISDCFMSNCTVPAQASTDTKDIYPGLWNE